MIVPSFTFVATAHALQWQQITPVFCDIDPRTHNIDPRRVEELITPRTTGILAVHVWGRPAPVDALDGDRRAARAARSCSTPRTRFGCSHRGRMIGGFGTAEVLSFHATKVVNAFEGGAIVTADDGFARHRPAHAQPRVRRLRRGQPRGDERQDERGRGGDGPDLARVARRASSRPTGATTRPTAPASTASTGSSWSPTTTRSAATGSTWCSRSTSPPALSRDELQRVLWAENVLARRYFFPGCHRMEPYRSLFPDAARAPPRRPSGWSGGCWRCRRGRPWTPARWRSSPTSFAGRCWTRPG